MDDNYQTYLNRVAKLAMPENYKSLVQHIHSSPKFKSLPEGGRKAVSFAGYTIIAPPAEEDNQNIEFYQSLNSFQKQLIELTPNNLIVPVPPSSFHITLADLIWESAYHYAQEKVENFDEQLHKAIFKIFEQYQQSKIATPIEWQVLGVIVMPRAIGVSLVPKTESAYNQILNLRRAIYQSPDLTALGLEQHYHFTPHITLGYFGEVTPELERDRLCNTISQLNQQLSEFPEFKISQAELRKFDDMTRYYRQSDWSILTF
ncbi:DUF1868 domain-containing protein [Synechocystis sp. PCC 7509]|uniref:DUF1868 domain-containing protein n=1 Tax=Synechocystis sp. PCC 7509 TaxID=927677 RepID=UPI0002ABB748|nr:DUF1868 domain-containing protein [Synechocystis sp. PCC 7509]